MLSISHRVVLGPHHRPKPGIRRVLRHKELPAARELRIAKSAANRIYHLIYCDAAGVELARTSHNGLRAAMDQASIEFGVRRDEWVKFRPDEEQTGEADPSDKSAESEGPDGPDAPDASGASST